MDSHRIVGLARWLAAAVALAGIVTVYHRWLHVNSTTVALTLLLFILLLAAKWGLRYAVVGSVAATICYNYYFLPPIGTFTIADPQNWLALLAFLVTAVTASRLSARIRQETNEARKRQSEVEMLFHLSRELLQTDRVAELMNTVPGCIAHVSDATAVLLYVAKGDQVYQAAGAKLAPPELSTLKEWMLLPTPARLEGGLRIAVPLRAGVRPRGVLVLESVNVSDETLDAMGGLISIAIDRVQALEEVTRGEAAKESERLRSVMLDSITHELRTPLTAIKAAVTTLLSPEQVNEADTRELLTVVNEESDRINHLVSQAVEMAQLDGQQIQMYAAPQPVTALIEGAMDAEMNVHPSREISSKIPLELPLVQADAAWIQKVLTNLLDNAIKYSDPLQPIIVSAELRGDMVWISVSDRGEGIEPMEQSMIFDKFYRANTKSQRVPGTGMGLAICRAIVEAHGGSIQVMSQVGHGSVFTFSLRPAE